MDKRFDVNLLIINTMQMSLALDINSITKISFLFSLPLTSSRTLSHLQCDKQMTLIDSLIKGTRYDTSYLIDTTSVINSRLR